MAIAHPEHFYAGLQSAIQEANASMNGYTKRAAAHKQYLEAQQASPNVVAPWAGGVGASDDPGPNPAENLPQHHQDILDTLKPDSILDPNTPIPEIVPVFRGLRRHVTDWRIRRNTSKLEVAANEVLAAATTVHTTNPPDHPLLRTPATRQGKRRQTRMLYDASRNIEQFQTDRAFLKTYHPGKQKKILQTEQAVKGQKDYLHQIAKEPLYEFQRLSKKRQRLLAKRNALR